MKNSPLRKISKANIPSLKRKLWKVFAKWVKLRDNNICFTCGKRVESYASQAGHFIPKVVGGIVLYFHPDNVHCQCSYCNLQLEGNRIEYAKKLGDFKVKELYDIKNQVIEKWEPIDYQNLIEHYGQCIKDLQRAS